MTVSTPSLLSMPNEILDEIFKFTDMKSIFNLRKVNTSLRAYLQSSKPDIKLTHLFINVYKNNITINLTTTSGFSKIHSTNYEKMEFFYKDLTLILDHVKSKLTLLGMDFRDSLLTNTRISSVLINYFKSRPEKLPVQKFFHANNLKKISQLLEFMNPQIINSIIFHTIITDRPVILKPFDLKTVNNLVQFQAAQKLVLENYVISESILSLVHLRDLDCVFKTVTLEEMVQIKELFINDPSKVSFKFKVNNHPPDLDRLNEALGPSQRVEDIRTWFYNTRDHEQIVQVQHFFGYKYTFSRVNKDYFGIPANAIILN